MSAVKGPARRAAPPRPTLLVADGLEGCHLALERLQKRMAEVSQQDRSTGHAGDVFSPGTASPAAAPWQDLVPLCRSLRETLTSLHELSDFTRRVYEAAADVCAHAGDWGEALKCITLLTEAIYPALAAGAASAAAAAAVWEAEEALADLSLGEAGARRAALGPEQLGGASLARWPEVASCRIAFFACVDPAGSGWDTAASLRHLPAPLLGTRPVQIGLGALSALSCGMYVDFFRLQAEAPPLLRLVLGARAAAERVRGWGVLSNAYRQLPASAAARMLGVASEAPADDLLVALRALAEKGNKAAQQALSKLPTPRGPGSDLDLLFK